MPTPKSKKGKQRAQPTVVEEPLPETIREVPQESLPVWEPTEVVDENAGDGKWDSGPIPPWGGGDSQAVPGAWDANDAPLHTFASSDMNAAQPQQLDQKLQSLDDTWDAPVHDNWDAAPAKMALVTNPTVTAAPAVPVVPTSTTVPAKAPTRRSSRSSRRRQAHGAAGFAAWQNWASEAAGVPQNRQASPRVTFAPHSAHISNGTSLAMQYAASTLQQPAWNGHPTADTRPTGTAETGWGDWGGGAGDWGTTGATGDLGTGGATGDWGAGGGTGNWHDSAWNSNSHGNWDNQNNQGGYQSWNNENSWGDGNWNKNDDSAWTGQDHTKNGYDDWADHGKQAHDGWQDWGNAAEHTTNINGYQDGWQNWGKPRQQSYSSPAQNYVSPRAPSRTMTMATNSAPDTTVSAPPMPVPGPRGMELYKTQAFALSDGEVLASLDRPLFGRERLAKDRLLWLFPKDKDPRVGSLIRWIQSVEHGLGAFGLDLFLEDYERGALVVNAATFYPTAPVFDWLSHEDAVLTRDKRLQESIGFYDPVKHAIVFVFLPSVSGNSAAVWRQKVEVPVGVRNTHRRRIKSNSRAAVKKVVYVDELMPDNSPPKKKRKNLFKRLFRVFKIFKVEW